ncbi:MAG TPA: hypothetical protein VH188_05285 [Chthoniobacterales bacterium]|jgi:hypothetical protein|nr:hypothetical protein [Chthoniobacterales bacterium]
MTLDERTRGRIAKDFSSSEHATVTELLSAYAGAESDRVRWDILEISKGDLDKVRRYVQAAQTDYRDILYWAEYYDNDPMLKGRDPKKMVDDILSKWGKKKGTSDV